MNDMTPAPISVERLRELHAVAFKWPPRNLDKFADAMHEALPALLHQLAERDAEVERVRDAMRDADAAFLAMLERAEAAERAREEATGLLRDTLRLGVVPTARIAAFLAASGGGNDAL